MLEWSEPVTYIILSSVLVGLLTIYLLFRGDVFSHKANKIFFLLIIVPVILSSFYLAGHTVYSNIVSVTKGPVHWHADYEVYGCGQRIDLIDPKFPRNKIGSPLLHEHNDNRMHVEGTVPNLVELNLEHYFKTVGGSLTDTAISYPTNNGVVSYKNGDMCNGVASTLKVYVNGKKVANPKDYVLYPDAYVPPGDCIIVEFSSSNSETTDKLCSSWLVKEWNYNTNTREKRSIGGVTWQ